MRPLNAINKEKERETDRVYNIQNELGEGMGWNGMKAVVQNHRSEK